MVRNLTLVEKGRSKPQNNRINNKMKPQSGLKADAALAHYAAACLYPFSEEAVGVRVPMPYEVRTRTTHLLTPYRCVVPSSGIFDAIITPNATYTLTSNLGTWTGGVNNPITLGPQALSGGTDPAYYIAGNSSPTNLSGIYSNMRIVSMGVRIKSNSNYTVTQGRIFVAVVPSLPNYPSYVNSSSKSVSGLYNAIGAPCDTTSGLNAVSSSIVSYPVSAEFAMSDLMEEGGVTIRVPKTSPRHQDFIGLGTVNTGYGWDLTGPSSTAGLAAGSLSVTYVNGTVTASPVTGIPGVDPFVIQTAGYSTVFIRGDGLSPSQIVEVEVIMHFEGEVAATNTTSSGGLVPVDDSALCAYGTSVDIDRVNLAVGKSELIKLGGPAQEPIGRAMLRELGTGAVRTVLTGTLGPIAGVVGGYAAKKVLGLMM